MATPFKLKSGNASAFKNLGSSPAKQMPKNWNKGVTPGYKSTKAAKTAKVKAFKDFDKWHNTLKKSKSIISNFGKKAGKFIGGKALGVAGMMMATSSKADQPKKGKGKTEYPGGKIDFTKKK